MSANTPVAGETNIEHARRLVLFMDKFPAGHETANGGLLRGILAEVDALQKDRRELIDALMFIRHGAASEWVTRHCEAAIANALQTPK